MVLLLLSFGAETSLIDADGFSPIHLATIFGHTSIVAYLVARGENVNQPDQSGVTPLMHAAFHVRERDPAQLLVRFGASVNYQHPITKNTALHSAISANNSHALQVLIDAGANTNIRNAENDDAFHHAAKHQRSLLLLLIQIAPNLDDFPRFLRFNPSIRRFAMKILPYFILITIGLIFGSTFGWIGKSVLFFILFSFVYAYSMIFADIKSQEFLPIAIAQASIFCLYSCYFYYFLPYVHVFSFSFIVLLITTYFSWTNYYRAIRTDPGFLPSNFEQKNRVICQLVEQNLFNDEHFCTYCLIRRPIRSKHCRMCRRCVSKFDHHCPWIDNCVGEKNLRSFTGFVCFTPICLCLFFHGSYLYLRDHCHVFDAENVLLGFQQSFNCAPTVLWFSSLAFLHLLWIWCLAVTIFFQIAAAFTTNERINYFRYKYFKSPHRSPFSLGWTQNLVDLINRPILCLSPIQIDWTRIYSIEQFYEEIPHRFKRSIELTV